ncbi:MAG TPA: YceI family protein [Candidatus Corynebacterium gallistercoris]|uniref:YceI family protein n=1 Tax=Candidatus Corynebacterium gallistercoris TaxID=2838530 RepID=A0A9D1RXH3_9CORY|nr:YceI family protein [Candidatus Corynebacterium gallistercoris]
MSTSIKNYEGTYTIDASHSEIGFSARHAMVTKVRGAFNEFSGKATSGTNLENASIEVTIDVASIDTRNSQRDEHLRAGDFFDAENHPQITFTSTSVEAKDDQTLAVTGDLTIKGNTQSVTIDFDFTGEAVDPWGQTRVGFEGSTVINRRDFGLEWQTALDGGGVLVSEKITLNFDISAVKEA